MKDKKKKSASVPAQRFGKNSTNPRSSLVWSSVVSSLPSEPGVYWFSSKNGTVLYVGKAKNLKNRVTTYQQLNQLVPRIYKMVREANTVKWEVLDSELEALLVEAELIRLHQPQFNVALKDDKTPLYVVITKEKFPKVLTARKKEINRKQVSGTVIGPFSSGYKAKEVLKIVRPIFQWCNKSGKDGRACFYYHLDMCPGACVGKISSEKYNHNIQRLIDFLRGKKRQVVTDLKIDMKRAAESENFEEAAELRDMLELINDVTKPKYKLSPDLVLPALKDSQASENLTHLKRILLDYLAIPKSYQLHRIEGYDVSNTSGKQASVSLVAFTDGKPDPENYRLFNIRTLDTPNDYHMMKEAILRRQNHMQDWGKPSLIVIDGGKGQLRAAMSVWHQEVPVISIAKNPDRLIIPLVESFSKKTPSALNYQVLKLPENNPALKLIQRVRDEAHRFSKKQHSKRRLKTMLGDN